MLQCKVWVVVVVLACSLVWSGEDVESAAAEYEAAKAKYISVLNEALKAATTKNDAAQVRTLSEKLKVLDPQAKVAPVAPAKPAVRVPAVCYGIGDDSAEVYLNGQKLFSAGNGTVTVKDCSLAVGDTVLVKVSNGKDRGSFALLFKCSNGTFVPTSPAIWRLFTPKNELLWYNPNGVENEKAARLGDADQKEKINAKSGLSCDPLWSMGDIYAHGSHYFVLRVTPECFVPQK